MVIFGASTVAAMLHSCCCVMLCCLGWVEGSFGASTGGCLLRGKLLQLRKSDSEDWERLDLRESQSKHEFMMKGMALLTSFGVVSFLYGVIAENKKVIFILTKSRRAGSIVIQ